MSRFAIILLAGGLRVNELHRSLGFPVPGLPLEPRRTVLQAWIDVLRADPRLANATIVVPCSSEFDRAWFTAELRRMARTGPVEVMLDRRPHRGVGGVVADVAAEIDPGLDVLVVEAGTLPPPSVGGVLDAGDGAASLVIGSSRDDRPAGVVLMRRRVLEIVPKIGYLDLKEQFIPQAVAKGHRAIAATITATALRLAARRDYLRGVRIWQERLAGQAKDARSTSLGSSVVCEGATVDARAVIRDSVVLPGAEISSGAVVARSVIGPMIRIPEGTVVVDGIVADPTLASRWIERPAADHGTTAVPLRAVAEWSHGR